MLGFGKESSEESSKEFSRIGWFIGGGCSVVACEVSSGCCTCSDCAKSICGVVEALCCIVSSGIAIGCGDCGVSGCEANGGVATCNVLGGGVIECSEVGCGADSCGGIICDVGSCGVGICSTNVVE